MVETSTQDVDDLVVQVELLGARNAQLVSQLEAVVNRLSVLETAAKNPVSDPAFVGEEIVELEPQFVSVNVFVDDFVREIYKEPTIAGVTSSSLWCSNWVDHEEVELLFVGLWKTYEKARANDWPSKSADDLMNWFHNMLLPTMQFVCSKNGPLALCGKRHCIPAKLGEVSTIDRPAHA